MALDDKLLSDYAQWAAPQQETVMRTPRTTTPTVEEIDALEAQQRELDGLPVSKSAGRFYKRGLVVHHGTDFVHHTVATYTLDDVLGWLEENYPDAEVGVYRRGAYTEPSKVDLDSSAPQNSWLFVDEPNEARQVELARRGAFLSGSRNYTPEA